ncbi:MAG: fumarylacetoacetate hydrolase family protein [Burkholderiaceae bacterium]|nr:fumarylacetoacetate hydrolase family protein [Burkholderiaceae bacterium]
MRIARCVLKNRETTVVVRPDGAVLDASRRGLDPDDLASVLAPPGLAALRRIVEEAGADAAAGELDARVDEVTFLPPLAAGARIFCVGINYRAHASETGRDMPAQPTIFTRTPESIVGHEQSLNRPAVSSQLDFEGELAVVIGCHGRNLPRSDAMRLVAGYTCFNDGSIRDFQKHSVTAGKNFDATGACGPWIVTSDEVPDPSALLLVTRLNGAQVQRSGTDLLIYPIDLILAYLSKITELRPGDIVATGTPAGVGALRDPPLWMKPGDRVEVEIDRIGTLRNAVVATGPAD